MSKQPEDGYFLCDKTNEKASEERKNYAGSEKSLPSQKASEKRVLTVTCKF